MYGFIRIGALQHEMKSVIFLFLYFFYRFVQTSCDGGRIGRFKPNGLPPQLGLDYGFN